MAARKALAEIYSAVEEYRFANAVQLANQLLKRWSGTEEGDTALALKALGLIKTDKAPAAGVIIDEMVQKGNLNEGCLQALTACCRELGRFEDIVTLYDAHLKLQPQNEELACSLFMALVRTKQYKRQQQLAMSMYKNFGNSVHYYWAVMSAVMQAHDMMDSGNGALAAKVMLPLAERMVSKAKTDGIFTGPEHLRLNLLILELQENWEGYLELLNRDQKLEFRKERPLVPDGIERQRMVLRCFLQTGKFDEASQLLKTLIMSDPDEWSNYLELFGLAKTMGCTPETYADLETFVDSTRVSVQEAGPACRGPFLGRLELMMRKAELLGDSCSHAELRHRVLEYTSIFGSKLCCFSDVKPFVLRLPPEERIIFATEIGKQQVEVGVSIAQDEPPQRIAQRWVLCTHLQWLCGSFKEPAERSALVDELLTRFEKVLPLGAELKPTEWQYADQYALTAAHVLTSVYLDSGDVSALYRAAVVLDTAIASSVSNMQLRLLATRVFTLLGATKPAWVHWEKCVIKQIQLDSVAYLMADHSMYLGEYDKVETMCAETLYFFKATNREMPEFIVNAYRHGSFGKVQEFQRFQKRIKGSLQFAIVACEAEHLLMLKDCGEAYIPQSLAHLPTDELLDDLSDNRDTDVMDTWNPLDQADYDRIREESRVAAVAWLRMRVLQVRGMSAVTQQSTEVLDGMSSRIQDAFKTGLRTVRTVGGGDHPDSLPRTVFPSGIHASRESLFGQYARFGFDVTALCSALDIARDVLQLIGAPRRGSEMEAACGPSRKATAVVGATLTAAVDKATTLLADTSGQDVLQNDVELLYIVAELIVQPAQIVHRLRQDLSLPPGVKEKKEKRQTRSALLVLLGEAAEAIRTPLTKLCDFVTTLADFDVKGTETVLKAMQCTTNEAVGHATSASVLESRSYSLSTLTKTLQDMLALVKE